MDRAYISIAAHSIHLVSNAELLGQLTQRLPFAIEPPQRAAWAYQICHLRELAAELSSAHFLMEFLIPRMGRRTDLIVLHRGLIFVIEYKVGSKRFDRSGFDQVYGYGLDLKHFHETSHNRRIVPILVATGAPGGLEQPVVWDGDGLARPLRVKPDELASTIKNVCQDWTATPIDPTQWIAGRYRPTPTIVEAAQALYRGHEVEEISRSEAGAENLTRTADYIAQAIDRAKIEGRKIICFITGVPGSGKTLAGLNLATARQRAHSEEHAVFLSGNGPLVAVLREALALDAVARAREAGKAASKTEEFHLASEFIQNIHHFRDEALATDSAPDDKVVIFDEAQRAWDVDQTSKFMQQKRGRVGFSMSEPHFLLSVMDRHTDWCAIVCLVGGGQEINTGEAGIEEWLRALGRSFPQWQVHAPESLSRGSDQKNFEVAPDLHLATSIRSFRAERLSDFVGHVIDGNADEAAQVSQFLTNYPLLLTRNVSIARKWLRGRRRGNERAGLLASSNAARLKPHGIFVKARIEPKQWFLAPYDDVRAADALEDAATEFDVQGLELDWACLCWDANFRKSGSAWQILQFKGTKWQSVNDTARQRYVANSYRVLLTRARQGLIVFVPEGDTEDRTRTPIAYDEIYRFLRKCGFQDHEASSGSL
jgi:hypothetical protein